jgi:hypothetical protein
MYVYVYIHIHIYIHIYIYREWNVPQSTYGGGLLGCTDIQGGVGHC